MSVLTIAYRYVVTKALTVFYSAFILVIFAINFIKNPFRDPWATKIRLEPPACLSDPKYGTHKYIKVNNIKIHYVDSGDPSKPLMIFVHGFPEFWYSWRHQIVEFNKDYWCIAVDMRGYGDSERPEELSAYKIELLVEDIRDLIRQLGREKCVLVSHDWGGIISCRFRDVHPDALDAVVLLASCSRESWFHELWHNQGQMKRSWYVFLNQMPAIPEKLLQMNNLELFDKSMLVAGKDTITEQDIECYKYWFGKQKAFTPPVNYYRANFLYSLPEKKFSEEKVPFLAVLAENDPYLETSLHDYMKKEYAHIETSVIKDCSHFLQQEEPVKVNKLIREFLAKNNL